MENFLCKIFRTDDEAHCLWNARFWKQTSSKSALFSGVRALKGFSNMAPQLRSRSFGRSSRITLERSQVAISLDHEHKAFLSGAERYQYPWQHYHVEEFCAIDWVAWRLIIGLSNPLGNIQTLQPEFIATRSPQLMERFVKRASSYPVFWAGLAS